MNRRSFLGLVTSGLAALGIGRAANLEPETAPDPSTFQDRAAEIIVVDRHCVVYTHPHIYTSNSTNATELNRIDYPGTANSKIDDCDQDELAAEIIQLDEHWGDYGQFNPMTGHWIDYR